MPVNHDPWLDRWADLLQAATAGRPLLELGCDTGGDTTWLLARGHAVVATDLSLQALREAREVAPAARFLQHDLRTPLPFRDQAFGAVIASLCLHYFDWRTTVACVAGIRRCLAPGGPLLCRVNSVHDVLHGAGVGEEIEPGFFRQPARYAGSKRFFTEEDLDRLFPAAEWETASREERTVLRYAEPKVAWELVLRRT